MSRTRFAVAVLAAVVAIAVPPPAAARAADVCSLPATTVVTAEPWAGSRLALHRVWPLTEGAGVVVGVVDTGVDAGHPLLAGRVLGGADEIPAGGPATVDCVGHGTFVAGLIAAARSPGVGFAGVAPQATILAVRQTTDGRNGTVATLAAGIRDAVDGGASVINVSITVDRPSPLLAAAVAYAVQRDVVVVAAAGNDAGSGNPVLYPAAYPGVLAVGAIGTDERVTQFSETGTAISVVAPGADLVGPGAGGTGLVSDQQGTSFAAAFVTGTVALVRAYRPGLRASQIIHRVAVTADHPAGALPDAEYGWGVVNPYQAVSAELPEEYGPAQTGSGSITIRVPAASPRPGARLTTAAIGVAILIVLAVLIAATGAAGRRMRFRQRGVRQRGRA